MIKEAQGKDASVSGLAGVCGKTHLGWLAIVYGNCQPRSIIIAGFVKY